MISLWFLSRLENVQPVSVEVSVRLALNPELCYNPGMDTINKMLSGAGGRLTDYLITTSLSFTCLLGSRPRLFWIMP